MEVWKLICIHAPMLTSFVAQLSKSHRGYLTKHIPQKHIIEVFVRAARADDPGPITGLLDGLITARDIISLSWISNYAVAGVMMAKIYFRATQSFTKYLTSQMIRDNWPLCCWIYHNIIIDPQSPRGAMHLATIEGVDLGFVQLDKWRCFPLDLFVEGCDDDLRIPIPFVHHFIETAAAGQLSPARITSNINILRRWDSHFEWIDEEHCRMLGQILTRPYCEPLLGCGAASVWAEFLARYLPK